jgi:lipid-A-disaccharide synthase
MTAGGPHVFLSSGEASGDRYGAALLSALRDREPRLRCSALGGPALAMAGADIVQSSADIAVMGFGEVAGALPAILRARRRVRRHLAREKIDLVIPIDFPGFNVDLAGHAHGLGLPVFYLVPPQLWAWGAWRVGKLRRSVDRVGTILPFEAEFFRARGLDVFPLGHPLMEDYAAFPFARRWQEREARFEDPVQPLTIGLLPGSRRQEIAKLLPSFKVAAGMMRAWQGRRDVKVLVSAAPGANRDLLAAMIGDAGHVTEEPLPHLLERLDLALVCSGTASLEAALAGVPHAIAYRTSSFNYTVARSLVKVPHIGLANLILGRAAVPELIQSHASPVHLANALLGFLNQRRRREEFQDDCERVREACGNPGVWARAAAAILADISERRAQA